MTGLFGRLFQKAGMESAGAVLQSTAVPQSWGLEEGAGPDPLPTPEAPKLGSVPVPPSVPLIPPIDARQEARADPERTPSQPVVEPQTRPLDLPDHPDHPKAASVADPQPIERETRVELRTHREDHHHTQENHVEAVTERVLERMRAPSTPNILQPASPPPQADPPKATVTLPSLGTRSNREETSANAQTAPRIRIDIGQITVKAAPSAPAASPAASAQSAPAASPQVPANSSSLTAYLGWRR